MEDKRVGLVQRLFAHPIFVRNRRPLVPCLVVVVAMRAGNRVVGGEDPLAGWLMKLRRDVVHLAGAEVLEAAIVFLAGRFTSVQ